jgi:hypothetical protein
MLHKNVLRWRKELVEELKIEVARKKSPPLKQDEVQLAAAIRSRVEALAYKERLAASESKLRKEFSAVFEPIPHVDLLAKDVYCTIKLKDPQLSLKLCLYSCPRKYWDLWQTLINQHLKAGRIRPSSSPFASPAFIVPKKDPTALPRWVNDYWQLNANTVTDSFPLPRIDDILADAGKGHGHDE